MTFITIIIFFYFVKYIQKLVLILHFSIVVVCKLVHMMKYKCGIKSNRN